jgi:hypothetical protein
VNEKFQIKKFPNQKISDANFLFPFLDKKFCDPNIFATFCIFFLSFYVQSTPDDKCFYRVAENYVNTKNYFGGAKDFCVFHQFSFGGLKEFLCLRNFRPPCLANAPQ